MGFEPRAGGKALVRKRGKNVHRIEIGSSHRNTEGYVVAWPSLTFEDAATRKVVKTWRAGGQIGTVAFAADVPDNVAQSEAAEVLIADIVQRLAFFDWLERPADVLEDVTRRYVPGLTEPVRVEPFLRAHLGEPAVLRYAAGLLGGRPELVPAVLAHWSTKRAPAVDLHDDHGTQLASVIASSHRDALPIPPGSVQAKAATTGLRDFFGNQLRAWGESVAARELCHVPDDLILRARKEQQKLQGENLVDNRGAVRVVLRTALGLDRDPARTAPEPRLFQYHALMGAFA